MSDVRLRAEGALAALDVARKRIKELEAQLAACEWIDTDGRLPAHDSIVLAWYPKTERDSPVIKARYLRYDHRRKGHFDSAEFEESPEVLIPGKHITHWMPLPDPPQQGAK